MRGGGVRVRLSRTMAFSLEKETISIVQLGVGFLLVFTAFNSAGFIQEGVLQQLSNSTENGTSHISPSAGYNSLATIYAVFTAANLVASPIVNLLSAKWAMVAGASCYLVFMLFFVIKVMEWSLYLSSGLLGFGAAILWTGQGTYITQNSNSETIGRNSGITWALLQGCGILGGIFLYIMFPAKADGQQLTYSTVRVVYVSFSIITGVGMLALGLLRQPTMSVRVLDKSSPGDEEGLVESISARNPAVLDSVGAEIVPVSRSRFRAAMDQTYVDFVDTLRLIITPDMLKLIVVFFFTGLETAFWTGVYATCLINTTKFTVAHNTVYALNAIFIGIGQVIGGGAFGMAGHRTNIWGRNPIIILGVVAHIGAYFMVYLILPSESPIAKTHDVAFYVPNVYMAFAVSFLLGFADSCWNTQIYSLLGALYSDNSAPAFASYKMFQSLGATLSFVFSSILGLQWQLLVLVVSAFMASIAFFPVEFKAARLLHARTNQPKEA